MYCVLYEKVVHVLSSEIIINANEYYDLMRTDPFDHIIRQFF